MSNFQIHELSTGALDRDSNIVHDSEVSGNYQTRKATAGAVADLALEVVASEYDDTASYAIGSYCIYSGVLYRCTTATTGAFDVSDWTAVLITGEYKRVRVMHKADFDLLTPEEKADGMIFVDDVDITASDISYDNTLSGLSASDLQEAVDDVSGKIDDLAVITQTYTVATYGGTIKFTRQGNIVTLQAYGIGVSQAISAVGVITLLSNIDERFLPANDVYIAGFRTSGYSTDHFQGYRLRDTSQRTLISYVYTSKPIDNGCFSIAYSV